LAGRRFAAGLTDVIITRDGVLVCDTFGITFDELAEKLSVLLRRL
jgi:hypothetical protein